MSLTVCGACGVVWCISQGMLDCLVYGMTNLKIRQRFTHSILSAIVSTWELLLAPVLVLPAFIAYTSKLLQPYLSSEKYAHAPPHTHAPSHARAPPHTRARHATNFGWGQVGQDIRVHQR
jgi:p-aminobenzoyl-glutamate transporter AbgT